MQKIIILMRPMFRQNTNEDCLHSLHVPIYLRYCKQLIRVLRCMIMVRLTVMVWEEDIFFLVSVQTSKCVCGMEARSEGVIHFMVKLCFCMIKYVFLSK